SHPSPSGAGCFFSTRTALPAGRSVKDVPERFVKDVMELDTSKGRSSTSLLAALSSGQEFSTESGNFPQAAYVTDDLY
ncbi:MAG: hypothetical protein ABR881_07515, partial [Candidatus Sulfotelmatobacter sp.]